MYKVINDGNVSVVFFTPGEKDKGCACKMVDEETIKDDEKLKEILDKKDYALF